MPERRRPVARIRLDDHPSSFSCGGMGSASGGFCRALTLSDDTLRRARSAAAIVPLLEAELLGQGLHVDIVGYEPEAIGICQQFPLRLGPPRWRHRALDRDGVDGRAIRRRCWPSASGN